MTVSIQTVADDEGDLRLDRFLRRRYPALTQGMLQKMCRTGQIRVDGARVDASARVQPGQAVRVPPMPVAPEKAAVVVKPGEQREMERLVVYRDDQIIVLNKPSGLATQGGPGITPPSGRDAGCAARGTATGRRLVHRLDRDTSGVILLARTASVAARLSALFRIAGGWKRPIGPSSSGAPLPVEGQIDQPLKRVASAFGERTVATDRKDKDGQRAYTNYRTVDNAGQKFAWMEFQPLTGRTHQIRVHSVALGTPIVGDAKICRAARQWQRRQLRRRAAGQVTFARKAVVAAAPRGWQFGGGGGPAAPYARELSPRWVSLPRLLGRPSAADCSEACRCVVGFVLACSASADWHWSWCWRCRRS